MSTELKPPQRRAHRAPAPLEHRRALRALVEVVGVKRAAEALHISLPSLARAQRGEPLNPATSLLIRLGLQGAGFIDERPPQ